MGAITLLQGDCLQVLATLPDESVQCCVTSPPYFGLRDYGHDGQIGLEATPDEFVAKLVAVFREVRRVLRDDGTLWLNLGDSYAAGGNGGHGAKQHSNRGTRALAGKAKKAPPGLKPKDLLGVPWMLAFALRADGWYLRQDIIWAKPNPMPESVTDRCTKAHEYIFLLSKQARYYFDGEAIKEPAQHPTVTHKSSKITNAQNAAFFDNAPTNLGRCGTHEDGKRNRRSVWTVTTKPFKGAHFATFPPDLIEPCILAGTSERGECPKCGKAWVRATERGFTAHDGDTETAYPTGTTANRLALLRQAARKNGGEYVNGRQTTGWHTTCECGEAGTVPCVVLDPFNGAGTTGVVAIQHGRRYIGIDLNPDYLEMSRKRIQAKRDSLTAPMFFASHAIGADAFAEA